MGFWGFRSGMFDVWNVRQYGIVTFVCCNYFVAAVWDITCHWIDHEDLINKMDFKQYIAVIAEILLLILTILWQNVVHYYRKIVPCKKKSVAGEIVLVTGAGSGLGRLLSFKFAELGAKVVCCDINESSNQKTVEEIKKLGGYAYGIIFDCGDNKEVYAAADKIRSDVGNVTLLVNNAGIASGDLIEDISDSVIKKTFEINTLALFWTIKAFLPHMKQRNHGHIVNVASVAGLGGVSRLTAYSASKFAVVGLCEALVCELDCEGVDGVYTTCAAPYFIDTGMFNGVSLRFPSVIRLLEPEATAQRIIDGILRNEGMVLIPWRLQLLLLIKPMLPQSSALQLVRFFGFSKTMCTYVGRQGKKSS